MDLSNMIKTGKVQSAVKCVLYGVEGIGKTTLASQMPDPLFIDTEGSTGQYNVKRLEPKSWEEFNAILDEIHGNPPGTFCKTLVIDTIDWAVGCIADYVCLAHKKTSIESFGYGTGYKYVNEEIEKLLNKLRAIKDIGIHVVIVAHTNIIKFELPEEAGSFDKYELKLDRDNKKRASQMVKEWADMVLFLNYHTSVMATDKNGTKHKAQGGSSRVMYTTHTAVWDAKNRFGLPDALPLAYEPIRHIFEQTDQPSSTVSDSAAKSPLEAPVIDHGRDVGYGINDFGDNIPAKLLPYMERSRVRVDEVEGAVKMAMGIDKPIAEFDDATIDVLIENWDSMVAYIQKNDCGMPF